MGKSSSSLRIRRRRRRRGHVKTSSKFKYASWHTFTHQIDKEPYENSIRTVNRITAGSKVFTTPSYVSRISYQIIKPTQRLF